MSEVNRLMPEEEQYTDDFLIGAIAEECCHVTQPYEQLQAIRQLLIAYYNYQLERSQRLGRELESLSQAVRKLGEGE